MPVAQEDSARDDKVRPSKSWRQASLLRNGELCQIELAFLLPLLFAVNVIVATIAWYVVGSLLR
jgi:hypothetical protein